MKVRIKERREIIELELFNFFFTLSAPIICIEGKTTLLADAKMIKLTAAHVFLGCATATSLLSWFEILRKL